MNVKGGSLPGSNRRDSAEGAYSVYRPLTATAQNGPRNQLYAVSESYHNQLNNSNEPLRRFESMHVHDSALTGSASAYQSVRRAPSSARRLPVGGEIRTANVVKSTSGFGFTLADTPSGQVVKGVSDATGHGQLRAGDVIVSIDGFDVTRETHENVVSLLKSYSPGTNVRIVYARQSRSKDHLRPRSVVPELLQSRSFPPESTSYNTHNSNRPQAHLHLITHPEDRPHLTTTTPLRGDDSGISSPGVLPRTSSLGYSQTDSFPAQMSLGQMSLGQMSLEEQEAKRRRAESFDRRSSDPVNSHRATSIHDRQKQYWMNLTSMNSISNFSGTPDFVPASLYSLPSTSDGNQSPQTISSQGGHSPWTQGRLPLDEEPGRYHVAPTKHSPRDIQNGVLRNSVDSNHVMTSSDVDRARERQLGALNARIQENGQDLQSSIYSKMGENGANENRGRTQFYGDFNQTMGSVSHHGEDPGVVYGVDIHRGSRGFGFSIRGGKEFQGMALFVLDIASGGPADMDGRMKNGDQILSINGESTKGMSHAKAIDLIQNATSPISLRMMRTSSQTGLGTLQSRSGHYDSTQVGPMGNRKLADR